MVRYFVRQYRKGRGRSNKVFFNAVYVLITLNDLVTSLTLFPVAASLFANRGKVGHIFLSQCVQFKQPPDYKIKRCNSQTNGKIWPKVSSRKLSNFKEFAILLNICLSIG